MWRWFRSLDGYGQSAIAGAVLFVTVTSLLALLAGSEVPPTPRLLLNATLLAAGGALVGVVLHWRLLARWRTDHYWEGRPGPLFLLLFVWPAAALQQIRRAWRRLRSGSAPSD